MAAVDASSPLTGAASVGPLYPSLEPYRHGMMDTGEEHRIYQEECGNPQGLPVVVLHGGPASGCSPLQRRFFDPSIFRIVLFDQRGSGRSLPRGRVEDNNTAALIRDIEQLRRQLGIGRWVIFGGSWGASLAIAYAASHPAACLGLILRGTFLTGSRDLDWFFGGAGTLLPASWQELLTQMGLPLGSDECEHAGHAVLATLKQQLFSDSPSVAAVAASAWARWEDAVSRPGLGSADAIGHPQGTLSAPQQALVDKYRVQAHYLDHQCFLGEDVLLCKAAALALPVQIVHGRLDWVCRPANAWQIHRAIAGSGLTWVDHGGHNPYDPPMLKALAGAIGRIRDSVAD